MAEPLELEEFALSNESVKSMEGQETGEEVILGADTELVGVTAVQTPPDLFVDEEHVENLLSEKLMNGFMLLENPCPKCNIPLVKKPKSQDSRTGAITAYSSSASHDGSTDGSQGQTAESPRKHRLVSTKSLEGISKPINCIPYCVMCESYVVTSRSDVKILARLKYAGESEELPSTIEGAEEQDNDNEDGIKVDTTTNQHNDEEELQMQLQVESKYLDSPSAVDGSDPDSPLKRMSPHHNNKKSSSVYFKQTIVHQEKRVKRSYDDTPSGASVSTTTSTKSFYGGLDGKRLMGIAASQDEGVEMKIGSSQSMGGSLAPSLAPLSVQEQPSREEQEDYDGGDDEGVAALDDYHIETLYTTEGVERELSLQEVDDEEQEEPNLDILKHESSVSAQASTADTIDAGPESSAIDTATAELAAAVDHDDEAEDQEGEDDDDDAQHQKEGSEYDSSEDNMVILCDSIHYIENDPDYDADMEEDKKEDDLKNATTPSGEGQEIAFGVTSLDYEGDEDNTDGENEADEQEHAEDAPGTKSDSSSVSIMSKEQTTDGDRMIQQYIEKGLLQGTDSKNNFPLPSYSQMLDGMKSPLSDGSVYDNNSTLDGVNEAANAILAQIKAKESKDETRSTTEEENQHKSEEIEAISIAEEAISLAEQSANESVTERLRKATLAIMEEVKKSESKDEVTAKAEGGDANSLISHMTVTQDYDIEAMVSLAGYESFEKQDDMSKKSATTVTTAASGSVADSHCSSAVDDAVMQEYTVRREIATKVLGSKMLKGYTLRDTQCEQCGMPQMEFKSIVHCVVCPVLAKKAKKELRRMQKQKHGVILEEEEDYDKKSVEDAIVDQVLQKHEEESVARSAVEEFSRHQKSVKSALKESSSTEKSTGGSSSTSNKSRDGPSVSKQQKAFAAKAEELRRKRLQEQEAKEAQYKPSKPPLSPSTSLKKRGSKASTPSSSTKSDPKEASKKVLLPPKATTPKTQAKSVETSTGSTNSDGWLYIASKSPPDIKTAHTRRTLLDTNEKILLEEARTVKEELKKLHKAEKTMKGDKRLAELKRRKAEATRTQELCKEQLNLIVEIKRLETMERMRLANEIEFKSSQEKLLAVFALQEERKRLRKEAKRLKEIRSLEAARKKAEIEEARQKVKLEAARKEQLNRLASGRVANEAEMAALEKGAERKRQATIEAHTATKKAEAPFEDDDDTGGDDDIAEIIAQGDADTIAEVSAIVRAQAEDYHDVPPSESDLWNERWETLRVEGRSVMTRRLISGWTMLPRYCKGRECQNSPLLARDEAIECVVCGGSGTGEDGAYDITPSKKKEAYSVTEDESLSSGGKFNNSTVAVPGVTSTLQKVATTVTNKAIASFEASDVQSWPKNKVDISETTNSLPSRPKLSLQSVQQIHEDFEEKRQTVSKEIGKRMLQGWTLLDMSCPNCVMPLLTDEDGFNEICVLCGVVGKLKKEGTETYHSEEQSGTGGFNFDEYSEEKAQVRDSYNKAATYVNEIGKSCKDAAPQFDCAEENAELSIMMSDTRKGVEKYASKTAHILSKQTKACMDDRRAEMEEMTEILSRQSKAYMDDRRAEMEQACDAGRIASMAYLEDQMGENCSPEHTARLKDMHHSYVETKDRLNVMWKEGEKVLRKEITETTAFALQEPTVKRMVALMSETPCSPTSLGIDTTCMSPKSTTVNQKTNKNQLVTGTYTNKQQVIQKKESYELGLDDIGDLGLTGSSFSVPDLGIRSSPAAKKGPPSEDGRSYSSRAREMLYGVSSEDVALTPSPKPEKYNIRAGSFEDLANQLSKADAEHRKRQAEERKEIPLSLSDETMDSMQPICDSSIIEDSIPSPRKKGTGSIFEGSKQSSPKSKAVEKGAAATGSILEGSKQPSPKSKAVKKGAAAVALELIREKRAKDSTQAEKEEKPRSFSFSANNRALKPLTIDTSPGKNEPLMSPRTPRSATSARRESPRAESPRFVRSSPRSSPNLGGARRSPSPRPASPGGAFRDYNDRLQHLLTSSSPKYQGTRSAPASPQKNGQDYLINFIAGRKSPSQAHLHADPPAMEANHVIGESGRRVARDPEDRSVAVDDDRSIASASSRFSRRSPRSTRPFHGASPGGQRSPSSSFNFPDSPTKVIRRTKENDEVVTLVIPKDFDITNDAQLRALILEAKLKNGPDPSPSSTRLALEGRIKHIGEAEFIDVTDLELPDMLTDIDVINVKPSGDENFDSSNSPRKLNTRSTDSAGAQNIVISKMHPPSPGESPFNNSRPRRTPRPKITPESMQNRSRTNRSKASPRPESSIHGHLRLSPAQHSNRSASPRGDAPTHSGSSGSSSIKFDNVSPEQFLSHSSSFSGKNRAGDQQPILVNMSFSSNSNDGDGSRYSQYTGKSMMGESLMSDSMMGGKHVASPGLPPISPRKRASRRPSSGSVNTQEQSQHQDPPVTGDNSITDFDGGDTSDNHHRYGGNSTVASGDSGFETGVTEGRSSYSSDQSYSSKRQQGYSSSSEGEKDIMVLNSRTDLGDIEVAAGLGTRTPRRSPRRSRRELIAAKSAVRRAAARGDRETENEERDAPGEEVKKSQSTHTGHPNEVISVGSSSFGGIISRIDSYKMKLAPDGGDGAVKEASAFKKMASFIGKLTHAAADVSTDGGETTDDETYSKMSSKPQGYMTMTTQ